jgi:CRISPR-associated protein Cas2
MLSGYRVMWVLVMFDLPVGTKEEKKAASDFRMDLLDAGFEMAQFSVYVRRCAAHTQTSKYIGLVQAALPKGGKVQLLEFTDKQYGRILTYKSGKKLKNKIDTNQLDLF